MKTLQNDYTTPEQSKRLLVLGVPEDSANLYNVTPTGYIGFCRDKTFSEISNEIISVSRTKYRQIYTKDDIIPCWSVGRLIKICLKCSTLEQRQVRFFCNEDDDEYSLIDYVVIVLESGVLTNHMDFSKLEE